MKILHVLLVLVIFENSIAEIPSENGIVLEPQKGQFNN